MKITYEFDPYDDADDLKMFKCANDMWCSLWHIYNIMRDAEKYNNRKLTDADWELIMDNITESGVLND